MQLGTRRYGISVRVFNLISHKWDIKLDTRRKIPHLKGVKRSHVLTSFPDLLWLRLQEIWERVEPCIILFIIIINILMSGFFFTIFRRFLNNFRRSIFWPFFGILFILASEYLAKLASSGKCNHLGYDAPYSKHEKSLLIPLHSL